MLWYKRRFVALQGRIYHVVAERAEKGKFFILENCGSPDTSSVRRF